MAAGSDALAGAKAELGKAEKNFPSSEAKKAGVTPANERTSMKQYEPYYEGHEFSHAPYSMAKKVAPKTAGQDIAEGLEARRKNVEEYENAPK